MNIYQRFRPLIASLQFAALTAFVAQAYAGNTWDGGGGDNNWGTGANWNPDGSPSPGSGNDLFFGGSTRLSPFNNYTAFDDWRNITFNSGASSFNLFGNAIDLFGKIENQSSNTQTVSLLSLALNSSTANEFNPLNGNLTILSTNVFTNNNQLNVWGNNGNTLSFGSSTIIQQGGAVSINENSTVVYNSAHTYTGDTLINAGKLNFNSGASAASSIIRIGATTGAASADMGLTSAAGGLSLGNTIVARAGTSGTRTIDSQNTSGTNALTGVIALDAPLTIKQSSGGTLNLTGSFLDVKQQVFTVNTDGTVNVSKPLNSSFTAGGSLVKQGSGTLILSNASNNYTGTNNALLNATGTQIAAGTLAIAADLSLGLAPAGAYNNIQFTGSSALRSDATLSLNANRNISIASGQTATFNNNGNTFTVNGVINGTTGNLASSGAGTTILTGANTYTGTTTVSSGRLEVTVNNALGTNAAGTTVSSGAALRLNAVNYSTAEALSINGTGISGGGALENIGTSTYAGQITAATNATINAGGGTLNLTGGLVKDGTILTVAGGGRVNVTTVGISGASAGSDLIVDGTTLVTSVASTYNGPTTVQNSGTLVANNTTGSATGTGTVTVSANSTLSGTGTVNAGSGNFIMINGTLQVGDSTLGSPVASSLGLTTSGAGSTVLGSVSFLKFDLFSRGGDLSATPSAADYVRLFGTLDGTAGGTLMIASNGLSGFASGDKWKLFDLTGPGTIMGSLNLDYSTLSLGPLLGGIFDNGTGVFSIVTIPEPSRALLALLGFTGLMFRRRRGV